MNASAALSMGRAFLGIAWPAFIAACLLELVVFALVDPQDLHWTGQPLGWSRIGVYSAAFFVFWAISLLGCALAVLLARPAAGVDPALRARHASSPGR